MTIEDVALTMTPGIGVKGAVHLLETFGDARRIFAASAGELVAEAALRADLAQNIVRRKGFAEAEKELAHCRRNQITAVASTDAQYPALLRETPDYPHVLYIRGNVDVLSMRCVAIVGTRKATQYGRGMCIRLVEELAELVPGLCIISGLAMGMDAEAHHAALAAGIPTIGVLPNALPQVMPTQHTALARDIVARGGALVTELHSQSKQTGNFYLPRNRIIAALSAGTIVVEAAFDSGSLHTAHYADGYNRTVMALPGRVTDKYSFGNNHLIRSRKAQLILSAQDVVNEIGWELGQQIAQRAPKPATTSLVPPEKELLGFFPESDPISVGMLGELSGLNPGELTTLLLGLELAGVVRKTPGDCYLKLR